MEENINQPENNLQDRTILPELTEPKEPDISLSDAMTGVITEPGVTFEAVKNASKRNYWLIPLLIAIILSIISGYLITHDDELYSTMKQERMDNAKKNLEERVKEGKMSQEDMNTRMEQMEKGFDRSSPLFIASLILGPLIGAFILLFLQGLIYWGVLKIFKSSASYMEIICVLGLVSIISSIHVIVNTALAIFTGNIHANLGLVLLINDEMVGKQLASLFSNFDIISIWSLIVIGIGFGKVSVLKSSVSLSVVFGLWIIWICLTSFVKLPFFFG